MLIIICKFELKEKIHMKDNNFSPPILVAQTNAQASKGLTVSTHDVTVLVNKSETVDVYVT